jgi:hypothetical protein
MIRPRSRKSRLQVVKLLSQSSFVSTGGLMVMSAAAGLRIKHKLLESHRRRLRQLPKLSSDLGAGSVDES